MPYLFIVKPNNAVSVVKVAENKIDEELEQLNKFEGGVAKIYVIEEKDIRVVK
jgi:hypothetical protein